MGPQQVGFVRGVPFLIAIVRFDGIARLLDVPKRPNHGLAVQDRADLVLGQPVSLDRKGSANAAYAVDAPQPLIPARRPRFARGSGRPPQAGGSPPPGLRDGDSEKPAAAVRPSGSCAVVVTVAVPSVTADIVTPVPNTVAVTTPVSVLSAESLRSSPSGSLK